MSRLLELEIHEITKNFPKDELYRSVDQLRRSSSSVSNNIAESYNKKTVKDKCRVLRNHVISEAEETESNILRCGDKGFLDKNVAVNIAGRYTGLKKATYGYIRFLNNQSELNN